MRRTRPALSLLIVLATTLACALPGASSPSTVRGSSDGMSTGTQAAPVPTPSAAPTSLEPLPAGLTDALQAMVEAGEITYEEGLTLGLELLLGEVNPEAALAQVPGELEGTGLVHDAQLYVAVGDDPSTRADLDRMLRVLAPVPEALLRHAIRESAFSGRGPGLARAWAAEQECAELWPAGFPTPPPNEKPVMCFKYLETQVGASTVQVFYPITELPEGFTVAFADAAMKAVVDSLKAYAPLKVSGSAAVLKNVQVIFSLLPGKSGAFALTPTAAGHDPCQIVLFPLSMTRVSGGPGGAPPKYPLFQQNVAHEMFHCFQIWNFPTQSADATWDVQDWWAESTAEYFSNVVYPATDDEWRFMDEWLGDSSSVWIFEESYQNFGLFQFLGNKLGNNGVLGLIKHMAPAATMDEDAQAAQLATFPGIQTLFAEYARDFVDGKIADTSKKLYPTSPPMIHPGYQVDVSQAGIHNLDATSFTLVRYKLTFAPGHEYKLTSTVQGGDGLHASRPTQAGGAWGDLPASVKPACGPTEYYLVMTTTQPASAPYKLRLEVAMGDSIGCDKCLVGTWDINIDSFAEYSEAPFAETPGLYTFDSAGGLWRYRFRPDGTMRGEFNFFYAYSLNQEGAGFGADITTTGKIEIDGTGEGTYLSDGLSNLTFSLVKDNVTLTDEIFINGQKLDASFFDQPVLGIDKPDTTQYSCDDEAGELLLNFAASAGLPPILYDRISTDPNKP